MRKFSYLFIMMIFMLLLAAGCGSKKEAEPASTNTDEPKQQVTSEGEKEAAEEKEEEKPADLSSGLEEVSIALQELQGNVDTVPQNADQLKTTGKKVEEKWDAIEEQVEEKYPDDYKNIEDSLYPLIDETKKDKPDAEKMTPLIKDTLEKINAFKGKVSSAS
ncbi:hypothetical protein [Pseudobacillus wudalianchiensis]|uniref:Lipoprotein n=1 Tax=Pseudobacillus wudalianchiensis TaxID=1743143 RepID=A0A1B9AAK8_9BACI|nr:hypothetical protein [Bacillus wudalianchiensis]OCA80877.1 hypothetical protein A8F95_17370 [Bacillus wudalianchiensis]